MRYFGLDRSIEENRILLSQEEAKLRIAITVKEEMERQGITISDMSKRTGILQDRIRRIIGAEYDEISLEQLIAISVVLNSSITIGPIFCFSSSANSEKEQI